MAPKIQISNLYKSFGDKKVLDGVNLSIEEGESLVVIGGSGTGKSVLIKCVLGLLTPDSGSIKIDGVEVSKISYAERRKILSKMGMLFQGGALFDSLKVWENISFSLVQNDKMNKVKAKEIAIENLGRVGLSSRVADLSPSELSGGMQKRVGLARAIATNPEVIFFDEPTTGLDPIMADVINDLIVKCTRLDGRTAFTITHDMESARKIGTRIAMLYQGKIIWDGTPSGLESVENEYVAQFVNGHAEGPIDFGV